MTQRATSRSVTRAELYEQVWSTPMLKLAAQYDISNVGLAKICRRLAIPTPGLGYWARIQHGQKPTRIALPPLKQGIPTTATIRPSSARLGSAGSAPAPRPAPPAIPIPDDLSSPHPAVRALRKALRGEKAHQGILSLGGTSQTPIRISLSTRNRAFRMLDGFFKGVETRGHTVSVKQEPGQHPAFSIVAVVGGVSLEITLRERVTQSKHVAGKGDPRFFPPTFDYTPSGHLTMRVGKKYGDAHRSWADGSRKPLEGKLGEAVLGLEQVAERQAEIERQREEQRRRWAEEDRKRELATIREQHEQELAKDLIGMSGAWRESKKLRAFLDAVEDTTPEEFKTSEGFRAWMGWARRFVDRRDPLTQPKNIPKVIEPAELRVAD